MSLENFFENIPKNISMEILEPIFSNKNIRIERIVSNGQCSPPDFWYDQTENEFVLLLKGNAELEFEDKTKQLIPGDFLNIPAHSKHRVKSTSASEPTIWLAIYYS